MVQRVLNLHLITMLQEKKNIFTIKNFSRIFEVIRFYAPVEVHPEGINKLFYELENILDQINTSDIVVILGHFNARMGNIKIE